MGCGFAGRSMAAKLSSLGYQYPTQALFLAENATDTRTAAVLLSCAEVAQYYGFKDFLLNKAFLS